MATKVLAAIAAMTACSSTPGKEAPPKPSNDKPAVHAETADPACRKLDPAPSNPALGRLPRKAAPLSGPLVDGMSLDLASLRGNVVLVSFQASWDSLTRTEQPTFNALSSAVGDGLVIVRVASEKTIEEARATVEAGAAYRTVFDRARDCSVLGAITTSWGVSKVPESFLVDRAGNVRFYFINRRDWSSPEAIACVRALAADPTPPIMVAPEGATPAEPCEEPPHEITGTITFGKRTKVKSKAAPAVIFVYAKAADAGGAPTGPPLAAAKLAPDGASISFSLTDGDVMIAGNVLAGDVVVTARYDQDGDVLTRQPGDFTGEARVTVPATGVQIVIDQPVP